MFEFYTIYEELQIIMHINDRHWKSSCNEIYMNASLEQHRSRSHGSLYYFLQTSFFLFFVHVTQHQPEGCFRFIKNIIKAKGF